jgi:hypothetical protein
LDLYRGPFGLLFAAATGERRLSRGSHGEGGHLLFSICDLRLSI